MAKAPWYSRRCRGPYLVASASLWGAGMVLALLGSDAAIIGVGLLALGAGGVVCLIGALRSGW